MFKNKNPSTDQDSLEEVEDEIDEAEIEELFQQQIPTGIGEGDHHRVFIVHPDVKWGSKKQYLTTGVLKGIKIDLIPNSVFKQNNDV